MDIETILKKCLENKASDLHILPNLSPIVRINGALAPLKEMPVLSPAEAKALIYTILTPEQQAILAADLVYELGYTSVSGHFRISIFHQMNGVGAVFRVVPQKVPTLEELELPVVLKQVLTTSRGLILVAGATGSGKSTTMAALIDYINRMRNCNIITIEDPIEFVHENKRSIVNQIQVGRDTPNFSIALRSSLRQDPDVIMLGELRDLETMRLALTAVETGHLVLATIHATSAPLAISRFADVFPHEEQNRVRTLLSETFEAIICQRLAKKIAGGRIAVYELLLVTPSLRHFIRQDMPAHMESAMQTGRDKGMLTFEMSLNNLVKTQHISQAVANAILTDITSNYELAKKDTTK